MIIIAAILLAIGVAIFPYVIWMAYLRGSGGRDRPRAVQEGTNRQTRPNPTWSRGDS
jgi:hypothetical protein